MQKQRIEEAPRLENPLGLDARTVAAGPAAQIMRVKLPAGAGIPPHPAAMVVDFVVLEGQGVAIEGREQIPVARGDVIRFEAGLPHGFTASATEGLELLAVKHGV